MIIQSAVLENYRNIGRASLEFDPSLTMLTGENGQGKTNLLEGLALFACGRSFRGARDRELLREGYEEAGASLSVAVLRDNGNPLRLSIRYGPTGVRVCRRNDVCVRSLGEFISSMRAVLFAAPQLAVVRESSQARRDFLDAAICALKPSYTAALTRANAVRRQRSALLKTMQSGQTGGGNMALLETLTEQFAPDSAYISNVRARYVARIQPLAGEIVREISGGRETLSLSMPPAADAAGLLQEFERLRGREIAAGRTLGGFSCEDMTVLLNGKNARAYASMGQQRSAALALKLAEGRLLEELSGERPVYLLDDVLSELDDGRRSYVLRAVQGRQVILTSCESGSMAGRVYSVRDGVFLEKE